MLRVKFQDTVQNSNFIVSQRLLPGSVELQERFEFSLLIEVVAISSQYEVEDSRDGVCDRGLGGVSDP